jgi:hypothetical protein
VVIMFEAPRLSQERASTELHSPARNSVQYPSFCSHKILPLSFVINKTSRIEGRSVSKPTVLVDGGY